MLIIPIQFQNLSLEYAKRVSQCSQPSHSIIENINIVINNKPTDAQPVQLNQEAQQL